MDKEICQVSWLGRLPYEKAWRLQERLAQEIALQRRPASFLLLEHPHTFTAGRSTRPGHLLWDETERDRRGVGLYEVDRGGDITYHGPGQLVGYPLFRLAPLAGEKDMPAGVNTVAFVRNIEKAVILALAAFGIRGEQKTGFSGVWVAGGGGSTGAPAKLTLKIASVGVKVDVNRVTRHGFALNVNPDMSYWSGIIACGLEGVAMTSMAACLDRPPGMEEVISAVISSFGAVFDYEMRLKTTI